MLKQWVGLLLFFTISCNVLSKELPSFYHSTSSLNEEMESIAAKCSSFISINDASTEPLIKQVNINQDSGKKLKAYILFGEHPRELISPESGLEFLRDLCNNPQSTENQKILDNYELRMIVNANPLSREKVEAGQFCLRENENGVDLNRNYDAHWIQKQDDDLQVSSGPSPFSEIETQTIRDSLKSFNADLFLSIHSGTLAMFTPHAYSVEDVAATDQNNMMDVLGRLQSDYCPSCEIGNAGYEIGYLSPGSCIDYAYDELNIKYSFAFEIYHQDVDLQQELSSKQSSFLQVQSTGKRINKSKNNKHHSCFLQMKTSSGTKMDDESCFNYFNPQSEQEYDFYINNWRLAMSEMLSSVSDKQQ